MAKPIGRLIVGLGVFWLLITSGPAEFLIYKAVVPEQSTFSIVAIDPATGDVGVAGASCAPLPAGAMATLVPGKGVGATQAGFLPRNQRQAFRLLQEGAAASDIIAFMSDESYDPNAGIRQYGAVTLKDGVVEAAGFSGEGNADWFGDRQDRAMAVSVQGNTLESEAVMADALAAFTADDIGPVALPDRLLRALEAASAAGGDLRCNQGDHRQTAQAGFIAVARGGDPPFAGTLGKEPAPGDPAPWLYISVLEAKEGPNPLLKLRRDYDAWRSENLPPCADCDLDPIPVPRGGGPRPARWATLQLVSRLGLGTSAGCLCGGSVALVAAAGVALWHRRKRTRSVPPEPAEA